MGKFLDSYSERKEFFEGIIDGVFYVKKYALDLAIGKRLRAPFRWPQEEYNKVVGGPGGLYAAA